MIWGLFERGGGELNPRVLCGCLCIILRESRLHLKSGLFIGKDPDAGKGWRQEEKGTAEDEMAGWHHWLIGREFEQVPGHGEGQGSLACCGPWDHKELDMSPAGLSGWPTTDEVGRSRGWSPSEPCPGTTTKSSLNSVRWGQRHFVSFSYSLLFQNTVFLFFSFF